MRDYQKEFHKRVEFIKEVLTKSGASGIVFGNSGGKDSALVGILCKAACSDTVGLIMPCSSRRNYYEDTQDALTVARKYNIETKIVDLTSVKDAVADSLANATKLSMSAMVNMAPRIRMLTLYAIAASENRLVAGTGNRSESYVGYFTKWGDGACDFNPIGDLTVTEIYEFLQFLSAPECVIQKAPSAALFDGQTDEMEMGFTYKELDAYLMKRDIAEDKRQMVEKMHQNSEHKRKGTYVYH